MTPQERFDGFCLAYDPFAGDETDVRQLSDKMVITRAEHRCTICWDNFPSMNEKKCKWCNGHGSTVVFHPVYGPEVTECPDCEGTGTAQGMEARRGETEGLDAKRDSPVGNADAPKAGGES